MTFLFKAIKTDLLSEPQHFFTHLDSSIFLIDTGSYLLSSAKHGFMLDVTEKNGQYESTFYDPNIGALTVTTNSAYSTRDAITEIFSCYIDEKISVQETRGDFYGFKKINPRYIFAVKKWIQIGLKISIYLVGLNGCSLPFH